MAILERSEVLVMVARSLPLFPLQTVLFPKGTLPLQIFEERYRLMLEHCLNADSEFGVVLIKRGLEVGGPATTYSVGTIARIIQVSPVREGRIFISVYGLERFEISGITQSEPYMAAEVETLPDANDEPLSAERVVHIREAAIQHVRLSLGMRAGWTRDVTLPDKLENLSYYLANVIRAPTQLKQKLLEERSTAQRLELEAQWIDSSKDPLKAQVEQRLLYKRFGRQ